MGTLENPSWIECLQNYWNILFNEKVWQSSTVQEQDKQNRASAKPNEKTLIHAFLTSKPWASTIHGGKEAPGTLFVHALPCHALSALPPACATNIACAMTGQGYRLLCGKSEIILNSNLWEQLINQRCSPVDVWTSVVIVPGCSSNAGWVFYLLAPPGCLRVPQLLLWILQWAAACLWGIPAATRQKHSKVEITQHLAWKVACVCSQISFPGPVKNMITSQKNLKIT